MDDREIIALLWARAERAIDALRAKFSKSLYRIAMNILENQQDAEEAENDTYLALWNAIPPARPDPLPPYVYKIGRNTALKHLRNQNAQKRQSRYDLSLEELSEILPAGTVEDTIDAKALGRSINAFLDTLPWEERALFVRRYWFGDDISFLAKAFSLSRNNTSVKLHRIRNKLKDYLNKEGFWL
ncbi:MAG: sigma-70 family RNA polymerase sigma factor [Oscillospiraceae bacterium]|nr:sigma-70 family RNA polymerase sigma factor [Oscillospiraceae bacterium]